MDKFMVKFFVVDAQGDQVLKRTKDKFKEFLYEPVQAFDQKTCVKAYSVSNFYELDEFIKEGLFVMKVKGYPQVYFHRSYHFKIGSECKFLFPDGIKISQNSPYVVFWKLTKGDQFFVQPYKYAFGYLFDSKINFYCDETEIDETSFHIQKLSPESKSKRASKLRLVFTKDYFEEGIISRNLFVKYDFKLYKFNGEDLLISKALDNTNDSIKMISVDFKSFLICIINICEKEQDEESPAKKSPSYGFNGEYSGWFMIVQPFLNFLEGLSVVEGKFLFGKIVHLSQSSGFGKTRLCIEVLRNQNRGIYCVHRMANGGYPKTTPWMDTLFTEFRNSTSDEMSMNICFNFVKRALELFGNYESNSENVISAFTGGKSAAEFKFDNLKDSIDKDSFVAAIESMFPEHPIGRKMFTFFFDESHELLISPIDRPHLVSLYRTLRKVFMAIKGFPIVACFLGTKSSLADFVLNAPTDPSLREPRDSPTDSFDVPNYILTSPVDAEFRNPITLSHESLSKFTIAYGQSTCIPDELKKLALMCGRPLWFNYDNSFHKAFEAARYKLECVQENLKELLALE